MSSQSGFDAGAEWAKTTELCTGKRPTLFFADFRGDEEFARPVLERWLPAAFGVVEIITEKSRWKECAGCVFISIPSMEFFLNQSYREIVQNFFIRDGSEAIVFEFNPFTNHFLALTEYEFELRTRKETFPMGAGEVTPETTLAYKQGYAAGYAAGKAEGFSAGQSSVAEFFKT